VWPARSPQGGDPSQSWQSSRHRSQDTKPGAARPFWRVYGSRQQARKAAQLTLTRMPTFRRKLHSCPDAHFVGEARHREGRSRGRTSTQVAPELRRGLGTAGRGGSPGSSRLSDRLHYRSAQPTISEYSMVRGMSIMYVSCHSGLGHMGVEVPRDTSPRIRWVPASKATHRASASRSPLNQLGRGNGAQRPGSSNPAPHRPRPPDRQCD
jgi:hypothetical protein